jgi:hypothetical protein
MHCRRRPAADALTDNVGIRVPVDGAVVYEDLAQCDIKVNHGSTANYEVDASTNDSSSVSASPGRCVGPPPCP